jgi:hypothetical protein
MPSSFVIEVDAARNMERRTGFSIAQNTTTMLSSPAAATSKTITCRRRQDLTLQHVCKRRRENSRSKSISGDFDTATEILNHQFMSSTVHELMRKEQTTDSSDEVDDQHLGADFLIALNDVNVLDGDENGKTIQTTRRSVNTAVSRLTNPRSTVVHTSKRDCSGGLSTTTTPTPVIRDDTYNAQEEEEDKSCRRRERYRLELLLDDLSCLLSTAITLKQTGLDFS